MLGLDTEIIMEICKAPTLRLKALNNERGENTIITLGLDTERGAKNTTITLGLDTERGAKNTTITLGLDTERGAKTQQSCWAWTLKEGQKHNSHVGLGH